MADNWVIELSRQCRPSSGEANLYGVILYTERHAHTRKMLEDDTYWAGLNEASGDRWVVFATRAAPGRFEIPQPRPGTISFLQPVWKEPAENKALLETFDISSTKNLPVLVVFAEAPDGEILRNIVSVDDSSEKASYKSLRKILDDVAESLDGMRDCYRRKENRAFTVVDAELQNMKKWEAVKKAFNVFQWLKSQL